MGLKHRLPAAIPTGLDQTEKEGMRRVCRKSRQVKASKLSSECQKWGERASQENATHVAEGVLEIRLFSRTNMGEKEERYRKARLKLPSDRKETQRNDRHQLEG